MKVVISGGTGLLGRLLAADLMRNGHTVVALSRGARASHNAPLEARRVAWTPDGSAHNAWCVELDGATAVVNLAGESIAGRRWTAAHKARILDSRVLATRSLVAAISQAKTPPPVFLSGSAVGFYGPRQDEVVDEGTPAGNDFLANVCEQWEAEASRAASAQTRVVCIRTGLVLAREGGALPKMLPPFWLGFGGPVGSGHQYWPWIHWQDWVKLARLAIDAESISGPLNATAPEPVTNANFARALGRAMHRPSAVATPGFALKLLLGEMADALLLSGQRAMPRKAARLGHPFVFPQLDGALQDLFK
jgi:uncharacterized protein (TIGR01777 family)